MGVPVQEQDQDRQQTHGIDADELNALLYARPALRLAGEDGADGDENEPHIWRGID